MSGKSVRFGRWLVAAALLAVGACGDDPMAPTDAALAPNLDVDVTVADVNLALVFDGQALSTLGLNPCSNGVTAWAIPAGKTRFEAVPTTFFCVGQTGVAIKGIPAGDYTVEVRPSAYSKVPLILPFSTALVNGPNNVTADLASNSGLLTGTLTVNGLAPGTAYRMCYDDPLIGPTGQNFGTSQFCTALPNATTFKMLLPLGTTSVSVITNNSVRVATLTFPAIEPGETTAIEQTNISVAEVAVQLRFNGQPLYQQIPNVCESGFVAAIIAGSSRADTPPGTSGCFSAATFQTLRGLPPGDYSFDFRPAQWSTFKFAEPVEATLTAGINNVALDVATGAALVGGPITLNGVGAGTDYRVCFDDPLVGPQGQSLGLSAHCSTVINGAFRMVVPVGMTSLYLRHSSSAAKLAVMSFEPVTAGQTVTLGTTDISTSELTVRLTYKGEPVVQLGGCYSGVQSYAIPAGKTRADNPAVVGACLITNPASTSPLTIMRGLMPGDYTIEVRPDIWSKQPFGLPAAVTLAQGGGEITIDIAANTGILTGTLNVNGQPATSDYRACFEYQRISLQNQNLGTALYCATVNNGGFKLYAPAGALTASIYSSSNQKVASIATAIEAGETTTLGTIPVGTPGATLVGTNVEVHPDWNGTTDFQTTVTFPTVTADGITSIVRSATGPAMPNGFVGGTNPVFYTLSTTAAVSGTNTICFDYTGTTFMRPVNLLLVQRNATNTGWGNITFSKNATTRTICGRTSTLGTFTIIEAANRVPMISFATGSANGQPGASSLTIDEGTLVTFGSAASDLDGDLLTYTWSFSDGAPTQSGVTVQRVFGDNGNVTATLTVKDPFNGVATRTVSLSVSNVAPTATFASSTSSLKEGESFTLSFSNQSDVPADISKLRYAFNCGMGDNYTAESSTPEASCVATLPGARTVHGVIYDKDGGKREYSATITVTANNQAPTAAPGTGYSGSEGVSIAFNGSGSTDPDGDPLAYEWNFDGATGQDGFLIVQSTAATPTFTFLDDGDYTATLTVRDGKGGSDTRTVSVTVSNTNPTANFVASPSSLLSGGSFTLTMGNVTDAGPADRMAGFTFAFHCGDGPAPESFTFGAATSASCPTTASRSGTVRNTIGVVRDKDGGTRQYTFPVNVAGNMPPTLSVPTSYSATEGQAITLGWMGSDPEGHAVSFAWDFGNGVTGSGSSLPTSVTYADNPTGASSFAITVTATDELGSVTRTATAMIANVAPTLGEVTGLAMEPAAVGSPDATMQIGASFTDAGVVDTHTGSVACGNGVTVPATIAGGRAVGSCTYSTAGVYRPSVTVTDDDNGSSTRSAEGYVVIYDPSAGFVTGGGWTRYDAESCTICGAQAGRGEFGFVSKYQKGASVPTGQTRFEFHAGALRFESTEYEWLVVANGRAQFRGAGRINGKDGYGFILTAVDGAPDTFRIRIWDLSQPDGEHIFDNRADAALDKVNGGGSITIHSK